MAHGFHCKRCGHQETPHTMPEHYPEVCNFYESPDPATEKRLWDEEHQREREDADRRRRASGIADDL